MKDTQRLKILKALTTLLAGITKANGYCHNLTVRRGILTLDDNDMKSLPVLSILEPGRDEETLYPESGGQAQGCHWRLFLTGFTEFSPQHPSDAPHLLMGDVKKRLSAIRDEGSQNFMLGMEGVYGLRIGGGICRPPDNQHTTSYFLLPITLSFIETQEAP